MSTVAPVSGTGSSLANSRSTIADNFDTFLQMLITQLKNQNPLEPMDTSQFTQQLVQFTSVEQQLKTNEFLEAMMQTSQNTANLQAVNYVGKTITASGASTDLLDGQAMWVYNVADAAPNSTVTIRDAAGKIVYQDQLSLKKGTDQMVWDGTTNDGNKLNSGRFTITIEARDSNGTFVPVTTEMRGVVEGVDVTGTEPVILIGDLRIPLSAITAVHETRTPDGGDNDGGETGGGDDQS